MSVDFRQAVQCSTSGPPGSLKGSDVIGTRKNRMLGEDAEKVAQVLLLGSVAKQWSYAENLLHCSQ